MHFVNKYGNVGGGRPTPFTRICYSLVFGAVNEIPRPIGVVGGITTTVREVFVQFIRTVDPKLYGESRSGNIKLQ